MLVAFRFLISFFCHSMTSIWALIFYFFLALQSWFADLTGWSALFISLFIVLMDIVVFASFLDLVPNVAIHSAQNVVKVMPSGATFNKLQAMAAKKLGLTACGQTVFSVPCQPGISTQDGHL